MCVATRCGDGGVAEPAASSPPGARCRVGELGETWPCEDAGRSWSCGTPVQGRQVGRWWWDGLGDGLGRWEVQGRRVGVQGRPFGRREVQGRRVGRCRVGGLGGAG